MFNFQRNINEKINININIYIYITGALDPEAKASGIKNIKNINPLDALGD